MGRSGVFDVLWKHRDESLKAATHTLVVVLDEKKNPEEVSVRDLPPISADEGHVATAVLQAPNPATADLLVQYWGPTSRLGFCGHATFGLLAFLARAAEQPSVHVRLDVPSSNCIVDGFAETGADPTVLKAGFVGPTSTFLGSSRTSSGVPFDVSRCGGNIFLQVALCDIKEAQQSLFTPDGVPEMKRMATALRVAALPEVARLAAGVARIADATQMLCFLYQKEENNGDSDVDAYSSFVLFDEDSIDATPCGSGGSAFVAMLDAKGALHRPAITVRSPFDITFRYRVAERISGGERVEVSTAFANMPNLS